jgi:hypothetical protein
VAALQVTPICRLQYTRSIKRLRTKKARDFVPGLLTHTSLETDPGSAAHHFVLRCARDDAYGVT